MIKIKSPLGMSMRKQARCPPLSQTSQRMKTSVHKTRRHTNCQYENYKKRTVVAALGDVAYEARDIVDTRRDLGRRAGFIVRLIRLRAELIVALRRLRAELIVALRLGAIGRLATFGAAAAEHARAEPLGRRDVPSRAPVRRARRRCPSRGGPGVVIGGGCLGVFRIFWRSQMRVGSAPLNKTQSQHWMANSQRIKINAHPLPPPAPLQSMLS